MAAFVVLVLVPQIKYPANPPSVGNPGTIGQRTALYFGMLALSAATVVAAFSTGRRFRLASLGIEAVLSTTLGLAFGAVAERRLTGPGQQVGQDWLAM
jgi:hypothetical protein